MMMMMMMVVTVPVPFVCNMDIETYRDQIADGIGMKGRGS